MTARSYACASLWQHFLSKSLVIRPASVGWQVQDMDRRLPPSLYGAIEDPRSDAIEYLVHHGGGRLVTREGDIVISDVSFPVKSARTFPGRSPARAPHELALAGAPERGDRPAKGPRDLTGLP